MVLDLKVPRRAFLFGSAAIAVMCSFVAIAQQSIARIVVPFPAGGPADIIARLLVEAKLGDVVGRNMIVENKPGASGMIGTQLVARAPADGLTYLLMPTFFIQNAVAYEKPGYDPIKDFVAVAPIGSTFPMWVVAANHPANTMAEFVADARSKPDKVTFASPGSGTANHLAGVALNQLAELKMSHIPYRGDIPGLQDVIAGHVTGGFFTLSAVKPHLESGQINGVLVTILKVPSFIATLTMLLIGRGIILGLTGGKSIGYAVKAREYPAFFHLGDAFIQPLRAAAGGNLVHEGMR